MESVCENASGSDYEYNDTIEDIIFLSKSNYTNKYDEHEKIIECKATTTEPTIEPITKHTIIDPTEPTKPDVEIVIKPFIIIPPNPIIPPKPVTQPKPDAPIVAKPNRPPPKSTVLPKKVLPKPRTNDVIKELNENINVINEKIKKLKETPVLISEHERVKNEIFRLESAKIYDERKLAETRKLAEMKYINLMHKNLSIHVPAVSINQNPMYSRNEYVCMVHSIYGVFKLGVITLPLVYLYKLKMYDDEIYNTSTYNTCPYYKLENLVFKIKHEMIKQFVLTPEEISKSEYILKLDKKIFTIGWINIFDTVENKQVIDLFFEESYKFTFAFLNRIFALFGLVNCIKPQKRKAEDVESSSTESSSSAGEAKRTCI